MNTSELMKNPLLSVALVARLLGLSTHNVRTKIKTQDVVTFKVGPGEKNVRVPVSELSKLAQPGSLDGLSFFEWLAANTQDKSNA